ncbi:MAG: cytochrome c [Myxococcaceae bacterium]|nr:cytochrome c [Myxococcaceae bacterium]
MRRLILVVVSLLSLSAFAQESVFPSKEEKEMARMLEPQQMSADVKAFIKGKMKAHNKDMKDLVLAVATLKYDECRKYAQGIANAPRLDKASGQSLDLPEAFFSLQDGLRKQATALVAACEAKKPDELLSAYNQMMGTCMSCHNAFLVPLREKTSAKK